MTLTLALLVLAGSPMSAEDKAALEGEPCKPFITLFKSASVEAATKAKESGKPLAEVLGAALVAGKKSTGMSDADFQRCNGLMMQSMKDFKAKSIEGEARVNVKMIAKGIVRTWDEDKKLCPGTTKPAPAELSLIQKGDYQFTSADWQDAAWTCQMWDPGGYGRQRFQYEVKADAKKKSFEVIARGYPYEDGELVTLFMTVELGGKESKTSELQRR